MTAFQTRYAGADWLKRNRKDKPVSPFGELVADILGELYLGLYHLSSTAIAKAEWNSPNWIEINVPASQLATADSNLLTRLVFIAHDACVRIQFGSSGPGLVKLGFSPRKRGSDWCECHPTLEEAVAKWREKHPESEVAA